MRHVPPMTAPSVTGPSVCTLVAPSAFMRPSTYCHRDLHAVELVLAPLVRDARPRQPERIAMIEGERHAIVRFGRHFDRGPIASSRAHVVADRRRRAPRRAGLARELLASP